MEDKPHERGKSSSHMFDGTSIPSHKLTGKLRDGFTTGTCAAAAAKAAAVLLCCESERQRTLADGYLPMELTTPAGITAYFKAEIVRCEKTAMCCRVRKDAGDDPDVTDKAWIEAEVRLVAAAAWEPDGQGYVLEEYPGYYLTGGQGVGLVTRPGLSCPSGYYAINPVPRSMILKAVAAVFADAGIAPLVQIKISVPQGEALAGKTFNPKLGIIGGISIIGTTGIVKPMSEAALRDTIRLELHMKAVSGSDMVFLVPGNYGEQFLWETLGVPMKEAVTCSNFVADSVEYAAAEGLARILFIGHIGKLIKVTGGVRNTHSRYGDRRMELLGALTAPYNHEANVRISAANTTEEAIGILLEYGLGECILNDAAAAVKRQMEAWGNGNIQVEVVTFSSVYGILGKTNEAAGWIGDWKCRKGGYAK